MTTDEGGDPYSPELADTINRAYEAAIRMLDIRNSQSDRRALLGRFLMDLAQGGETNEAKLRDGAVAAVKRADWIRHQAHELWESEGRPHGRHDEHWAQAEREFLQRKGEDE